MATASSGKQRKVNLGPVFAVVVIIVLTAIVVWSFMSVEDEGVTQESTVVTPSETATPEPVIFKGSDQPQPKTEDIWNFETAYFAPVGADEKQSMLQPYATDEYLQSVYNPDAKVFDKTITVIESSSIMNVEVDDAKMNAVVRTQLTLRADETNGQQYTYTIPEHVTYWINTPEGWKVAREGDP